jgi:ferrous iron transport protein A
VITLDAIALDSEMLVEEVEPPAGTPEWGMRLADLGFVRGERVRVLARGRPGGEPLVVRIGDSTFALRRAEAACVRVQPSNAPARVQR